MSGGEPWRDEAAADDPLRRLFDAVHHEPSPDRAPQGEAAGGPHAPRTRREAREAAQRRGSAGGAGGRGPRRPRRGLLRLVVAVVIVLLLGGGAVFAFSTLQPLGLFSSSSSGGDDYSGAGSGRVTVTIKKGDTGSDIADTLHADGVTKTSSVFYDLLVAQKNPPVFQPGTYRLRHRMSARAALHALQDPDNRLSHTAVIPEGLAEKDVLKRVSTASGVPLKDLKAAASDPSDYGLPSEAETLEGFLFPATYTFEPGESAHAVVSRLVERAFNALDEDGVPKDERWKTVVLASVVQREAGGDEEDFGKIARVFVNRIAKGMPLQSDATVTYGTGKSGSYFTSDAEREDAHNPYNTYVHKGLPPGPIGNPGDVAIKAALHPTPGDWLYFVTINLKTGRTEFSTTLKQQEKQVAKLHAWCKDPSHASYCR